MKLIIGLGNPGRQYAHTRHNIGFDVIDTLADSLGINVDNEDFFGVYGYKKYPTSNSEVIMLFKPHTFMNLSGKAVRTIINFYKCDIDDLMVIYDDMDTDIGEIRVKLQGGPGGHHGIEDIIRELGTEQIRRVRVGIGRPEYNSVDYVLTKPTDKKEKQLLEEAKNAAVTAVLTFIKLGLPKK